MNDAPAFVLSPLCWVADAAQFSDWVQDARPGDTLVYARGVVPPRTAAVWMAARDLSDMGGFILFTQKDAGETQWMIRRTAAATLTPDQRARMTAPAIARTEDGEPVQDAMLRLIRRAVNLGMAAPTNGDLGRAGGVSRDSARYHLRQMEARGAVRIIACGRSSRQFEVPGLGITRPTDETKARRHG